MRRPGLRLRLRSSSVRGNGQKPQVRRGCDLSTYCFRQAVELSGPSAVVPRVCVVGTAWGDDARDQMEMSEAGRIVGFNLTHLSLLTMPNLNDIEGHLMGPGRRVGQRRFSGQPPGRMARARSG